MESIPEEPEAILNKDNSLSENRMQEIKVEFDEDPVQKSTNLQGILNGTRESKMKSRRVTFPDGDNIIMGYNEAPNPWAHASCASNDELIQEYLNSCQEWNVKPITKLLLQLKEINDFSVRTASLTLKGEKIDNRVVETLESILRRVQFVIIDLEATNLNDDSAAALFDMIEYYESAVNVLIGFNKNLGTRGWQAAAHMMRKMSCLRLFDGHSVPLSNSAVPFVGRALRLSNTLVTLHLENSSLSGRPMLLIVAALRMNVTLQELFLADNQLLISDALQLGNLLRCNSTIHLLDIRNNLIQDAGVNHLCNGLQSELQTCSNGAGGGGLQTLVLWNNQISHQSLNKLAQMLKSSTSLLTLNLGQNYLGDEGATKIKEGLLQNRSILRLGLVGTKMTCEGAIALAEFLVESSRIIRLDLRNNNIKVAGLMALSLAAKINHSLFRLDIDRPLAKNTIKELAEKQESLMQDISTYTTRNKELASKKVMMMQQEKPIRYMDMTSSSSTAQTSLQQQQEAATNSSANNNATNNNSADEQQGNASKSGALLKEHLAAEVDEDGAADSPTNSPQLLPISSVSYHQISPVMISSSEMEKRAQMQAASQQKDDEAPDSDQQGESSNQDQEENSKGLDQEEPRGLDQEESHDLGQEESYGLDQAESQNSDKQEEPRDKEEVALDSGDSAAPSSREDSCEAKETTEDDRLGVGDVSAMKKDNEAQQDVSAPQGCAAASPCANTPGASEVNADDVNKDEGHVTAVTSSSGDEEQADATITHLDLSEFPH